jgi:hypothetical protein
MRVSAPIPKTVVGEDGYRRRAGVLVKLAHGIIGTAAGIETCARLFHAVPKATEGQHRERAKKREDFPQHRSDVFASSREPKNRRILRNLIVNCTYFATPDAPKVTLKSHLNDVFPTPSAT